jgi:acyl carrier protein
MSGAARGQPDAVRSRINALLASECGLDTAALGTDLGELELGDLHVSSLALLSLLTQLEDEFRLTLDELRRLARAECSMRELFAVCRVAWERSAPNAQQEARS